MLDTFQAVWVAVVAVLPGAAYVWSFEREAGAWGLGFADRSLRFLAVSVVIHVIAAPLTYAVYRDFVRSGTLERAEASWWAWAALLAYTLVPTIAGFIVGRATRAGRRWASLVTGPAPAPRAWDHLFSAGDLTGWVRLRLKNGEWIAGAYATADQGRLRSYAAGYPHTQDLYLVETAECDPRTGRLIIDDNGMPRLRGIGILIQWDEVAYLEFARAGAKESL